LVSLWLFSRSLLCFETSYLSQEKEEVAKMVAISLQIEGQMGLTWPRWKRLVAEIETLRSRFAILPSSSVRPPHSTI
jgi:hypothetical protein